MGPALFKFSGVVAHGGIRGVCGDSICRVDERDGGVTLRDVCLDISSSTSSLGHLCSRGVAGEIGDMLSLSGNGGDSDQLAEATIAGCFSRFGLGAISSATARCGLMLSECLLDFLFFFFPEFDDGLRLLFFFFSRLCFFSFRRAYRLDSSSYSGVAPCIVVGCCSFDNEYRLPECRC